MALPKLFQRIFWHNNTTPAIQEDNLNAMSKGLSDVDDRVIGLAGTIMEDVPQIQEDIEELEADMALIDTKIASATAEANRATTAANNAAASVISAGNKALVSEGWAKGTQNGAAVGSSSPYYHNNAEYFKNQARSFTPQGYQDLVDDVDSLKETLTNFEESITGEVVDDEPYVLRQGLGNLADMNLVGGSVAWNQLVGNGNFASTSGWNTQTTSFTVSNNIATVTPTAQWGGIFRGIVKNVGHKYLLMADVDDGGYGGVFVGFTDFFKITPSGKTGYQKISIITNNIQASQNTRFTLSTSKASDIHSYNVKNAMCIDLTQMFGTTIADYIYSLEQATAGAGVEWFRKYFSKDYYGYQSGKIESVNVASRKVIGKNLYIGSPSFDGYSSMSDYQVASELYNGHEVIYKSTTWNGAYKLVPVKKGVTYTFSAMVKTNGGARVDLYYDSSGRYCYRGYVPNTWTKISGTFTPSKDGEVRCKAELSSNGTIYIAEYQIEVGETATNYEPYQSSTYAFDSSKQLRGIPKLVDNKLSYDGDIYTADGTVTRKYGIADLGDFTYTYRSDISSMITTISDIKGPTSSETPLNALLSICPVIPANDRSTTTGIRAYVFSGETTLYIRDSGYTDATAFKTAMTGQKIVYELATPTTESANAYQNPQRAFLDGTEEFVDYGVQSATRDVSIPVGNNTTYQLNETLPPTEDYVDGALKFKAAISALGTDESGRTTASRAYTTGEFFYKDRKMYKVLTSIAQGATFTINTNCQQTTLFAELKALAQ